VYSGHELILPSRVEEREEVGRTCCIVMGNIAAELEVEYLLATPSASIQTSHASNEDKIASSFSNALREGILFCHSLGERQLLNGDHDSYALMSQRPYEYREPLTHLLPCIMSLVSNVTSSQEESELSMEEELHFALAALCKNDCLVLAISKLLHRASKLWNNCFEAVVPLSQVDDSVIQQFDGVISLVKLCALIIDELTMIVNSPGQKYPLPMLEVCRELRLSLELWKKNLKSAYEWPSQTLRSSVDLALNQVSHCLLMLESQSGI